MALTQIIFPVCLGQYIPEEAGLHSLLCTDVDWPGREELATRLDMITAWQNHVICSIEHILMYIPPQQLTTYQGIQSVSTLLSEHHVL